MDNACAQIDQKILRSTREVAIAVERQHPPAPLGDDILNLDIVIDAQGRHYELREIDVTVCIRSILDLFFVKKITLPCGGLHPFIDVLRNLLGIGRTGPHQQNGADRKYRTPSFLHANRSHQISVINAVYGILRS